jgi:desulfoferrodoxin (superoxide reductase-like protein)
MKAFVQRAVSSFTLCLIVCFIAVPPLMANKSSVEIKAPAEAAKGSTVTITVTVSHSGNNRFHYTDWVYVKAGDKEIARWNFGKGELPENEKFTRDVQYTITDSVEIEAKANCNIHGSTGEKKVFIKVK